MTIGKPGRRDVIPSKDKSGWDVTQPGRRQPESHHRTQTTAEKAAKAQLRREGTGGEVVIHRRDGRIRDKDTIPPARDPNPPKDRRH
jgi:Uncharacterized protein conserved in bacteria (DUF2188)